MPIFGMAGEAASARSMGIYESDNVKGLCTASSNIALRGTFCGRPVRAHRVLLTGSATRASFQLSPVPFLTLMA